MLRPIEKKCFTPSKNNIIGKLSSAQNDFLQHRWADIVQLERCVVIAADYFAVYFEVCS